MSRSRESKEPRKRSGRLLEGLKSGNVAETCRKYEIAPNLYYRWKDEVEAGAKAALGGGAQPRSPMPSRRNGSNNWSGRWVDPICRSRS